MRRHLLCLGPLDSLPWLRGLGFRGLGFRGGFKGFGTLGILASRCGRSGRDACKDPYNGEGLGSSEHA